MQGESEAAPQRAWAKPLIAGGFTPTLHLWLCRAAKAPLDQGASPTLLHCAPRHSHGKGACSAVPGLPKAFQPQVIWTLSTEPPHLPALHQVGVTMCGLFVKRGFGGLKQIVLKAQDSVAYSLPQMAPWGQHLSRAAVGKCAFDLFNLLYWYLAKQFKFICSVWYSGNRGMTCMLFPNK